MKILITRPEPDASQLAELFSEANIETCILPLLNIRFFLKGTQSKQPEERDKLIFVSKNAVQGYPYPPEGHQCFAVGKSTTELLKKAGFEKVICPQSGEGAAALLAIPELQEILGQHFIIVCGVDSRDLLEKTLRARGAKVSHLITYQTHFRPLSDPEVDLLKAPYDAIVSTSSHAMRHLAKLAKDYNPKLFTLPLTTLNENMIKSARELGFTKPLTVASFQNKDIYESLRHYFSRNHSRK